MIHATALAWVKTLERSHLNDPERDIPRITAAFEALMDTCYEWPVPPMLLDHLPAIPKPYFQALPKPTMTEAQAQEAVKKRKAVLRAVSDALKFNPGESS